MQEHRLARPGVIVATVDHADTQPPVDREIAFVASYQGEARVQLKGGVLPLGSARTLGRWLLEVTNDARSTAPTPPLQAPPSEHPF